MPDPLHVEAHSLTFYELDGRAHISLATTEGQHIRVTVTPSQCAMINEGMARYVANQYRQAVREVGKPKEVPFSAD